MFAKPVPRYEHTDSYQSQNEQHNRHYQVNFQKKFIGVYTVSKGFAQRHFVQSIFNSYEKAMAEARKLMSDDADTDQWKLCGHDYWVHDDIYVEVKLWEVK
jgi:hypothetical protein